VPVERGLPYRHSLPAPPDLEAQARAFADDISRLLNTTVTNGIRLSAFIAPHLRAGTVLVGNGVGRQRITPISIALTLGTRPPHAWLDAAYTLQLDEEGVHLTVSRSRFGLYLDDDMTRVLAHWDYEREPVNDYPAAHVQVAGESEHFNELCNLARERLGLDCPSRSLGEFHFPVGGRRYRPTIEDVIEFLIVERLVEWHPGWRESIDERRRDWEVRQLRAAVRRNPDVAIEELGVDGHLIK
jgi:hypothetical protein